MDFPYREKKLQNLYYPADFIQAIPSLITSYRIVILPQLAFAITQGFVLGSYVLFVVAIASDFIDGRIARKLGVTSKFGSYLDSTVDFIFITGIFGVFVNLGVYPNWLLYVMPIMYFQFLITNLIFKKALYDPIGKYYGSLLFAAIGLTLLFPSQFTYNIVTIGIVISTLASIVSRLLFFNIKKGAKDGL